MLVAVLGILFPGCKTPGPKLQDGNCILDPDAGLSYCYPPGKPSVDKKIAELGGYTCFSPDDTQILLDWIDKHTKSGSLSQDNQAMIESIRNSLLYGVVK